MEGLDEGLRCGSEEWNRRGIGSKDGEGIRFGGARRSWVWYGVRFRR